MRACRKSLVCCACFAAGRERLEGRSVGQDSIGVDPGGIAVASAVVFAAVGQTEVDLGSSAPFASAVVVAAAGNGSKKKFRYVRQIGYNVSYQHLRMHLLLLLRSHLLQLSEMLWGKPHSVRVHTTHARHAGITHVAHTTHTERALANTAHAPS